MQKGSISVQTENIFPIIKKFLYSDQEIFLRELVSNAIDATSKLKTLSSKGEFKGELGDLTIEVIADKENKKLTIRDKGIGMDEEEVKKYLNQVAFSSAQEFLEKYKDESSIIGHFGLGFYSAFMVADKVEVVTRSHKETDENKGVTWICEGNPEYTIEENDKSDRGTDIVLHISEDATEFLEDSKIQDLLDKYCKFLPVPIQFGMRKEYEYEGEGEDQKQIEKEVPNVINDKPAIWNKTPNDLEESDYKEFYNVLYPYSTPPMFWIHLNIDYPFNLTGILYFPKLNNNFEVQKNKIQLYSNQVYVTDEVKEIVPEFLTMLHGIIDSPDIPLNVSRSYLQSDRNVKKITSYITKKVSEKLNDLFKKDRKDFEEKWKDLGVFVKYGMISEEKFYDKAINFGLLENVKGEYYTIEEYKEKVKEVQTDKHNKIVLLYANNKEDQHSLIEACESRGYDVLIFDHIIDNHFMQQLEQKVGEVTFVRVDSDTVDNLVQKDEEQASVLSEEQEQEVKTYFEEMVKANSPMASVITKALSPEDKPILITKPEFMRRMQEMQAMQGMNLGAFPDSYNVVINTNHQFISDQLLNEKDEGKKKELAQYLLDLGLLNQNMLKGEQLTKFINQSLSFIEK